MRSIGKDVVAIKLLRLRNAAHLGKQPLHVIVVTVRRNDLIGIAVRDQHLSTAAFQRMQVRRVGADELRKLLGQIALLGEELLFADLVAGEQVTTAGHVDPHQQVHLIGVEITRRERVRHDRHGGQLPGAPQQPVRGALARLGVTGQPCPGGFGAVIGPHHPRVPPRQQPRLRGRQA